MLFTPPVYLDKTDLAAHQVEVQNRKIGERTASGAPASFEELFVQYYDYVVNLVASVGINPQNSEDVAMTILATFFEKQALEDYDPEYRSTYDGKVHKAVFKTFLSGFVLKYVRHHRDRQHKLLRREGFSTDHVLFRTDDGEYVSWMDFYGPTVTEEHEDLEADEAVAKITARLSAATPRNDQDLCDLPALFAEVQVHTSLYGKVDVALLAATFSVSKTSIQNWMKRLRAEVTAALDS